MAEPQTSERIYPNGRTVVLNDSVLKARKRLVQVLLLGRGKVSFFSVAGGEKGKKSFVGTPEQKGCLYTPNFWPFF